MADAQGSGFVSDFMLPNTDPGPSKRSPVDLKGTWRWVWPEFQNLSCSPTHTVNIARHGEHFYFRFDANAMQHGHSLNPTLTFREMLSNFKKHDGLSVHDTVKNWNNDGTRVNIETSHEKSLTRDYKGDLVPPRGFCSRVGAADLLKIWNSSRSKEIIKLNDHGDRFLQYQNCEHVRRYSSELKWTNLHGRPDGVVPGAFPPRLFGMS